VDALNVPLVRSFSCSAAGFIQHFFNHAPAFIPEAERVSLQNLYMIPPMFSSSLCPEFIQHFFKQALDLMFSKMIISTHAPTRVGRGPSTKICSTCYGKWTHASMISVLSVLYSAPRSMPDFLTDGLINNIFSKVTFQPAP
jgi:hypothetical protein